MTLQIPVWLDPGHITLAAVRACGDNLAAVAAANWTGNPFLPSVLPATPTSFAPSGVPNDGGYYMRENVPSDAARPIPFVEFWVDGQPTLSQYTDGMCSIYQVRLGIRARVSSAAFKLIDNKPTIISTAAQVATLHNWAISLCRLAQITTSEFLRDEAIQLEPTSAFGICWNDILSPPSVDLSSPVAPDGNGTISADAVSFIDVYQRLFVPAGIGGNPFLP